MALPLLALFLAPALPFDGPAQDGGSARNGGSAAEWRVESQGGLFVARLAKAAGQERVADALARWKLDVRDQDGREQWSCFHPAPDQDLRYLLSEEGAVFVAVDPRWSDSRPVVMLRRAGGEPERIFGGELEIPREALRSAQPPGSWLSAEEGALRFTWILGPQGPRQMLELGCLDTLVRAIDLDNGLPTDAGGGLTRVWVEPALPEPPGERDTRPPPPVPPVSEFSVPSSLTGDQPLVVHLAGAHPNPGWAVWAFSLELEGDDAHTLAITPHARPPLPTGRQIQQVEPYRAEARIHGLPPGEWRVVVLGRDGPAGPPVPVEVTPGGRLARLATRGGILGLEETITLYENGVFELSSNRTQRPRLAFAPPRAFAAIREKLSRLPGLSPGANSPGSDLQRYDLTWLVGEQWRNATADDGSARGELREAIDSIRALAHP